MSSGIRETRPVPGVQPGLLPADGVTEPAGGLDDTVDVLWAVGTDLAQGANGVKGFSQVFRWLGKYQNGHPSYDLPGDARNTRIQRYLGFHDIVVQGPIRTGPLTGEPGDPPAGTEVDATIYQSRFIKDPFDHANQALLSFAQSGQTLVAPTTLRLHFSKSVDPATVDITRINVVGFLSGVQTLARTVNDKLVTLTRAGAFPIDTYTLFITTGAGGVLAVDGSYIPAPTGPFSFAVVATGGGGAGGRALLNPGLES